MKIDAGPRLGQGGPGSNEQAGADGPGNGDHGDVAAFQAAMKLIVRGIPVFLSAIVLQTRGDIGSCPFLNIQYILKGSHGNVNWDIDE